MSNKPNPVKTPAATSPALFPTVTGRDFGRSIKWARKTPNAVREMLRAELAKRKAIA